MPSYRFMYERWMSSLCDFFETFLYAKKTKVSRCLGDSKWCKPLCETLNRRNWKVEAKKTENIKRKLRLFSGPACWSFYHFICYNIYNKMKIMQLALMFDFSLEKQHVENIFPKVDLRQWSTGNQSNSMLSVQFYYAAS